MKCPKCDYISFGDLERCTNCGYDFALMATASPPVDLDLRDAQPSAGPPAELPLAAAPARPGSAAPPRGPGVRDGRAAAALHPADLPLFDRVVPGVDDTPLLTAPAPPRAPLSVRRSAPEAQRPTPQRPAERGVRLSDQGRNPPEGSRGGAGEGPGAGADPDIATPAARVAGAVTDLAILGAIDLAVVFFTLRLTGLDFARVTQLPAIPLIAFLLLLNGGYVVGFTTASGQTIGKMLTGTRVVSDAAVRVPLGQAIVRAAGIGLTLLSLGLGYLPALTGRDRRALHDRLSGTRVLRR